MIAVFDSYEQQYGDIHMLYTACKHRGFVMISYYDIRASQHAMKALQNKPLRHRKLDIHFSIPKVCMLHLSWSFPFVYLTVCLFQRLLALQMFYICLSPVCEQYIKKIIHWQYFLSQICFLHLMFLSQQATIINPPFLIIFDRTIHQKKMSTKALSWFSTLIPLFQMMNSVKYLVYMARLRR